ncbi:winged helix-turn-helix transcriptional regulator [Clostridiaceae bacterium NSJ-31]|uniref:Winged helix-turn-helix transcriptional regulator n=1 Tax=Ligaoa zhengdingensis TaxID=2763658 RepID=A0A926DXV4_9FIRM|nr:MarR family winged helix-turn-helix transcriptional regulator [Ligaoa zhengdingensis]MBC8545908.1 winged helix-turn-helix transcriptional regulator [Ligaoa zhengdingensis]
MEFWNLLSLSKRLYDQSMQPVCEQFGVARMELDVLLFLANNPPYDTAKDIVERRRLTKSHVSTSVNSLIARGYLEPSFQQGNHKTVHLRICPAARELLACGQEAQSRFVASAFAGFRPEEIKEMGVRFGRIAENVRAALTGGMGNAL